MKIHVVKDRSGKVVASFETGGTGPTLAPVLHEGEKAEEVEVAENYKENLKLLYSEKRN
jgi:hypothetical protein